MADDPDMAPGESVLEPDVVLVIILAALMGFYCAGYAKLRPEAAPSMDTLDEEPPILAETVSGLGVVALILLVLDGLGLGPFGVTLLMILIWLAMGTLKEIFGGSIPYWILMLVVVIWIWPVTATVLTR